MYTGNCRSGRRYDSMFLSLKYWVLVLQKWKYRYKAYFSLTWPVAMHIHLASSYAHLLQQKKCLHKKRVQLPLRLVWTTNCFLFFFGTPTGQRWNHDKSLYILKSFFFSGNCRKVSWSSIEHNSFCWKEVCGGRSGQKWGESNAVIIVQANLI